MLPLEASLIARESSAENRVALPSRSFCPLKLVVLLMRSIELRIESSCNWFASFSAALRVLPELAIASVLALLSRLATD
jgi:hypothetical protein